MALSGRYVLVIAALLIIQGYSTTLPPPQELAAVIAAMNDVLQARRIHIISGYIENLSMGRTGYLVRFMKQLSSRGLMSHCVWTEAFVNERYNFSSSGGRFTRSMQVFLSDRPLTQVVLRHISSSTLWGFTTVSHYFWSLIAERNPLWLLWLEGPIDQFFTGIVVPMNSQFYVAQYRDADQQVITLTEVYHVARHHPLQKRVCGNYSADTDTLSWTTVPVLERRGDLQGITLKAVTNHNPPHTLVDVTNKTVTVGGTVGRLWNILERKMNFTTMYTSHEFPSLWAAVQAMHFHGEDVAVLDYPLMWSGFVEFTSPLFISRYYVFIRNPGDQGPGWGSYLEPFSPWLWLCYGLLLVLLAGGAAVCSRTRRRDALFDIVGVATLQGPENVPEHISSRIVYLTSYIVVIVVMAAYSANIIAYLTVRQEVLPFHDIDGLLHNEEYTFIVTYASGEDYSVYVSNDPTLQAMYGELRQKTTDCRTGNVACSVRDGLQKACSSKFAFFVRRDQVLANSEGLPCQMVALPNFYMSTNVAITTRKDLPYLDLINYHVTNMRVTRVLDNLLRSSITISKPDPEELSVPEVGLQNVKPILALLLVAMVTATLIAGTEVALQKKRSQRPRQYPLKRRIRLRERPVYASHSDLVPARSLLLMNGTKGAKNLSSLPTDGEF